MFRPHQVCTYLRDILHPPQNHLILSSQYLQNLCQYQHIQRVSIQYCVFFLFQFHLRLKMLLKIFQLLVGNENKQKKLQRFYLRFIYQLPTNPHWLLLSIAL